MRTIIIATLLAITTGTADAQLHADNPASMREEMSSFGAWRTPAPHERPLYRPRYRPPQAGDTFGPGKTIPAKPVRTFRVYQPVPPGLPPGSLPPTLSKPPTSP